MAHVQSEISRGSGNTPIIRHFSEINLDLSKRPCLIVGKGPSFSPRLIQDYRTRLQFFLVSINNAWTGVDCMFDFCVFSDWPVSQHFKRCEDVYYFLCGTQPFNGDADFIKALKRSDEYRDRLYFYDHEKWQFFKDKEPISLKVSSSEAAVQILARFGAKEIHFNGMDGTKDHHEAFEPRAKKDVLSSQFTYLEKLRIKYGLTYSGLPV